MSVTVPASLATAALEHVLGLLAAAGIEATRDAGALTPDPIGVLVGLPTLTGRTLGGSTYTVPVTVVSGDPLAGPMAVDRLYVAADDAADAIGAAAYSPSSFSHGFNAEPLPALELIVTVSLSRTEE
jgi:hypothetical protein